MPTEQKNAIVEELKEKIGKANGIFLTDFQGLNVEEINRLRRKCREVSTEYRVAKNTLTYRAIQGSEAEKLQPFLKGPIALAIAYENPAATAKVLSDFSQENKALEIGMGIFEGKIVDPDEIVRIAKLPPREVMLTHLLAGLQAPISGLVGVLSGLLRNLVSVLDAIARKKEGKQEPPGDTAS